MNKNNVPGHQDFRLSHQGIKLDGYNVFEDVGEFLDSIPFGLRRAATEEYKKFLLLKFAMEDTATPAILSPSEIVDQVWHVHLMRPTVYNNFCNSCFGILIDHDIAASKSSELEKQKRYENKIASQGHDPEILDFIMETRNNKSSL